MKSFFKFTVAWIVSMTVAMGRVFGCQSPIFGLGVMPEEDFQKAVLSGINEQKELGKKVTDLEKTLANMPQWTAESKAAMEEFTKQKNALFDGVNSMGEVQKSIKSLQLQIGREKRMAFGDPIQRLIHGEENKMRINAELRSIAGSKGINVRSFFDRAEVKALGEGSTPGSTYIDDALSREIYDTLAEFGAWNALGVRNVGTKTTKYPVKTVRADAKFVRKLSGSKLADDTAKAGTSVSIDIAMIGGLVLVDSELLEDEEVDVAADVISDLVQSINGRMDFAAFVADGTDDANDAEFTGLFEAGTAVNAASGNTTVETLDFADIINTMLGVDEGVWGRQTNWWLHPFMLTRMLNIKDSNGRPIFLTALEAPAPGSIGSILGSPVRLVYKAPNTNTAGNAVAAFGDPQAYVVAVRNAINMAADESFAFDEVRRAYRGTIRAGFGIRDAGGISVLTLAAS